MKRAYKRPSGPAIVMYCLITVCALCAAVCFYCYYVRHVSSEWMLWVGITAFMIVYHLWLRLIFGNITKLFHIHYGQWWFRERKFEKKLYAFMNVRHWKKDSLTYDPAAFSLKERTLEQIANTMAKSETDHWINEGISLFAMLFALIWGKFWIFALTSAAAMIFDGRFIVIQRYNRPRVLRVMQKEKQR